MNEGDPILTDLILGFLAGACIRRSGWCVLVWIALPIATAILVSVSSEMDFIVFLILITGFIATGAGLALGALFRALIKRISPKTKIGTNSQDVIDAPADRKV